MGKLYSIGDTAKIMGLSVQTLRNYTNTDLLTPAYINEETGYRYFSFQQFHIIDRIKYLRSLGLSLAKIEEIVKDGSVDTIVDALEERGEELDKEIRELQEKKADLYWYRDYFKYHNKANIYKLPRVEYFEERYILYADLEEGDTIEDIEVRLAKEKTKYIEHGSSYYRQFGYVLDYWDIMRKDWKPRQYYIFVKEKPKDQKANIRVLKAGYYLCIRFHLYQLNELNTDVLSEFFGRGDHPETLIANEYEDNLISYTSCPYELQAYLE